MDDGRKRLAAIGLAVAVLILAWFRLADPYPTGTDCVDVATSYLARGFLDQSTADEYHLGCDRAVSKEERQALVDRMNEEASLNASGR